MSGSARLAALNGPGSGPRRVRRAIRARCKKACRSRIFIFTPFIALVLVMVGATAIVALRTADDDAAMLATSFHQQVSANIGLRLDDYLVRSPMPTYAQRQDTLTSLLRGQAIGTDGRAFILDQTGKMIASSAPDDDPVIKNAVAALAQHAGSSGLSTAATEFKFDHVRARPLSRETWLTYATPYRDHNADRNWILVTAMPEAFYLAGLRSRQQPFSDGVRIGIVALPCADRSAGLDRDRTAPRMARATQAMARGDMEHAGAW